MKWTVHDDNDDQMVYSVYYRGDGETRWLLLKDNLTDKFYSFDASLAGWRYTIEVMASDAPRILPVRRLRRYGTVLDLRWTPRRPESRSQGSRGRGCRFM